MYTLKPRERAILISGVIVILVGIASYIFYLRGGGDETVYSTPDEYSAAQESGKLPTDAPDIPACATGVAVIAKGGVTDSISFNCADKAARDEYVAEIKKRFDWNVFLFDPDKVKLERVGLHTQ